jgi:hypothetical protein
MREIPIHRVCDHLWGSVAPSMQHFYVVQLWTWLCAVHSGVCSPPMVAGSLMCLLSDKGICTSHILNHNEHAWLSGLLLVISICSVIIKSRAPYPWLFPLHYTCCVHLCILAMNFHWCDILHMQILDYTAKCPSFQWACHLWIDYTVTHHAYGALSWLYDDKGDLHMPVLWWNP